MESHDINLICRALSSQGEHSSEMKTQASAFLNREFYWKLRGLTRKKQKGKRRTDDGCDGEKQSQIGA